MCPHTTMSAIYVSSYYYVSVLRVHEAQQDPVLYMYTNYIRVRMLLYMCPIFPTSIQSSVYVRAATYTYSTLEQLRIPTSIRDICVLLACRGAYTLEQLRIPTAMRTALYAHTTMCATQSAIYVQYMFTIYVSPIYYICVVRSIDARLDLTRILLYLLLYMLLHMLILLNILLYILLYTLLYILLYTTICTARTNPICVVRSMTHAST
jgi:hypothetical protein